MQEEYTFYIVDKAFNECYDIATLESAESRIADAEMNCIRLKKNALENAEKYDSEYWMKQAARYADKLAAGFEAVTWEEYQRRERKKWLSDPVEVSAADYDEALNVLPPLNHCEQDNVVMFCMSEFTTGVFTGQYAHDRETGKYWYKMVDAYDTSTWIVNDLRSA